MIIIDYRPVIIRSDVPLDPSAVACGSTGRLAADVGANGGTR